MSKTKRKAMSESSRRESPAVAVEEEEVLTDQPAPEEVSYDPASGCMLRLFWMMLGNLALLGAGYGIIETAEGAFGMADVAYWGIVGSLLAARYADIRYMNGRTAEGQPATIEHWRRYAMVLVAVSTAAWIVSHAVGKLLE